MEPIIQIKNVGKKYTIKQYQGNYIALRDVLMTILRSPLKFLKKKAQSVAGIGSREEFWALKDLNLDIQAGEVIGVIGSNGAGKSTLLKILTGITPPTTGEIKMRGRVASLLEVGTGFHPELTGRENIFLNGAILGMPKKEIVEKFDEIVEFSGIGKFLDTPVKYYSSGMYVRLAFSVAAHLEPDILLVDEVLAVGDAEFQRKCLGKMEEVTKKQGRTILFVSHNMTAIQRLCSKTVLMKKGQIEKFGKTEDVVSYYLSGSDSKKTEVAWEKPLGDDVAVLTSARLINEDGKHLPFVTTTQQIGIEISYEVLKTGFVPLPNIHVFTSRAETAFISVADYNESLGKPGKRKSIVWIPSHLLNEGRYTIGIALSNMLPLRVHAYAQDALTFDVVENIETAEKMDFNQRLPGVVRPKLIWESKNI